MGKQEPKNYGCAVFIAACISSTVRNDLRKSQILLSSHINQEERAATHIVVFHTLTWGQSKSLLSYFLCFFKNQSLIMMAGRPIALKAQQPIIVMKALVQYYTVGHKEVYTRWATQENFLRPFQIYKHSSVVARTLGKKSKPSCQQVKTTKTMVLQSSNRGG